MFSAKYLGFVLLIQTFLTIDSLPVLHKDITNLQDDNMNKEEIQNEFEEPIGNFEHYKSMIPSNAIMQHRNVPIQSQGAQLHTFKKEFPLQTSNSLEPTRLQTGPKKFELIISPEDSDMRKAQKTNETFQKLLQFVSIMGQIDDFLKERAQSALQSIAQLADDAARAHKRDSIS